MSRLDRSRSTGIWVALIVAVLFGSAPQKCHAGSVDPLVELALEAVTGKSSAKLVGPEARLQLLATARLQSGATRDWTRLVSYSVSPGSVVKVEPSGMVTPVADGSATITCTTGDRSAAAAIAVTVSRFGSAPPVSFPNQIVPIFTKTGCNAGGCHGKSSGQNGFRLSLLGFEPKEDYAHLVEEARGRRLFPAAPEQSLLLLKAVAALPHGGGKRVDAGSDDYRVLCRWIGQGMPYGNASDPTITSVDVRPAERVMTFRGEQQLQVAAHYSDGSVQDVTRSAIFESGDKTMATVDTNGGVHVADEPGLAAVMVRYQGQACVFRATLPLGAPVTDLPAPANFIDELVFARLRAMGIPPSPAADDGTFLRRVTLDIGGRLPTLDETRQFLGDSAADKREKCVARLLASPDYADFFANKWSALLRNRRTTAAHAHGTYELHDWLRQSFEENKRYDALVREILTASGTTSVDPPVAWYRALPTPSNLVEDAAQLFLGTRLQCAQCHHHPYEKWSQQDYFGMTAFFSQLGRKPRGEGDDAASEEALYHRRGLATAVNLRTQQPVKPTCLGGKAIDVSPEQDPRIALAAWMTQAENPFFARALVNRYWKHFMGRGLVEPEDDLRATNPATNPELLDALARHFVEHGYDLKELIGMICRSKTYQLSSVANAVNASDRQCHARYYSRRLPAEVLFDAVNQVAGAHASFIGLPSGTRAVQLPDNSFNAANYFLTVFGRPDFSSACECERSQDASLSQVLHLLNSKDVQERVSGDASRAALLAADAARSDEEHVREIYLAACSRQPDADELALSLHYLARQVKVADGSMQPVPKRAAYEDMIWAMLNTKEFLFNH